MIFQKQKARSPKRKDQRNEKIQQLWKKSDYLQHPYRAPENPATDISLEAEDDYREPPPDHGRAWLVMVAGFMYEGLGLGLPVSYGVFQDYYSSQDGPFQNDPRLPTIGVLVLGALYLGCPIMSPVTCNYPSMRPYFLVLGLLVEVAGLIGASFAKNTPTLILTQGFVYSLGNIIFYIPLMSIINDWFEHYRGLVYGIVDASTGLSGLILPFVFERLLYKYGAKTTLQAYAVALAVLTAPFIPVLRPRLPRGRLPQGPEAHEKMSVSSSYKVVFRQPWFHFYAICALLQGFGFFFPIIYLPSYATSLGLSSKIGALLVALLSIGQMIGQTGFGLWSDKGGSLKILMMVCTLVPATMTLTMWGLARSTGPLVVFSLAYGIFAFPFVVLFARMATSLSDDPQTTLTAYGLFSAAKGLGNVLEGPLSMVLRRESCEKNLFGLGKYAGIIGFAGGCLLLSGLIVPVVMLMHSLIQANREGTDTASIISVEVARVGRKINTLWDILVMEQIRPLTHKW